MNKTLEMVRTMINGANEYEKKTGDKNPPVYFSKNNLLIIEQALKRLESIDTANPSEALECLEYIKSQSPVCYDDNGGQSYVFEKEFDTIKQALLKAQEQEKELKSEINVLFSYMEFTKLFFEIFNLNYSNETFTLSLIPNEQYNIENVDLKICLIKEDADKILKVAELLEKEVEE